MSKFCFTNATANKIINLKPLERDQAFSSLLNKVFIQLNEVKKDYYDEFPSAKSSLFTSYKSKVHEDLHDELEDAFHATHSLEDYSIHYSTFPVGDLAEIYKKTLILMRTIANSTRHSRELDFRLDFFEEAIILFEKVSKNYNLSVKKAVLLTRALDDVCKIEFDPRPYFDSYFDSELSAYEFFEEFDANSLVDDLLDHTFNDIATAHTLLEFGDFLVSVASENAQLSSEKEAIRNAREELSTLETQLMLSSVEQA